MAEWSKVLTIFTKATPKGSGLNQDIGRVFLNKKELLLAGLFVWYHPLTFCSKTPCYHFGLSTFPYKLTNYRPILNQIFVNAIYFYLLTQQVGVQCVEYNRLNL